MGYQDEEVDWSSQALSGKPRSPVVVMIRKVGNEKNNRDYYCGDLANAVGRDAAGADVGITGKQEYRTGAIKDRIDVRQI